MRRILTRVVAGAAAVLALSGCIKLDMDMKLGKNEKLNGTFIVGVSTQLLTLAGQTKADIIKSMKESSSDIPKGAKVETYDKDGYIGQKITFKDLPASEFSKLNGAAAGATAAAGGAASSSGNDLKLAKVKGNWQFSGTIDLSSGSDSSTPDLSALGKAATPSVRIKMTFPGKILKHDKFGKVDGNTVTWTPKTGQKVVMLVVAETS